MKCEAKDCQADAIIAPQLCVPATGFPAIPERCMKIAIRLKLCLPCFLKMKASDWLEGKQSGPLRAVIRLTTKNRVPPDLRRAFFTPLALDGSEIKMLDDAHEKHKDT